MATAPPEQVRTHYALTAAIAARGAAQAVVAPSIAEAVAVALRHQIAAATVAQAYVAAVLREQDVDAEADALLNSLAFTTETSRLEAMMDAADDDAAFRRLVASIVQDAGRAAESVAVAVRQDVYHVRYVNPPCCGRCAVLAGRRYRWSDGFLRHPGCDCVMVPTTVASPIVQDPEQLVADGMVRGLSKADAKAVTDGADLGQVVNVRKKSAGLREAGSTLTRAGRPTPAGIYRRARTRDEAVAPLGRYGYIR